VLRVALRVAAPEIRVMLRKFVAGVCVHMGVRLRVSMVLSMEVHRSMESWEILVEIWEVPRVMLTWEDSTERSSCRDRRSSKESMVMVASMEACRIPEDFIDPRGRLTWDGSDDWMEALRFVVERDEILREFMVMEIECSEGEREISDESERVRGREAEVRERDREVWMEEAVMVAGSRVTVV